MIIEKPLEECFIKVCIYVCMYTAEGQTQWALMAHKRRLGTN